MDFQNAIEAIKQHLPDYAEEYLKRSKVKNQYNCIFCGSGTGANSTGAFTVYRTNYYCFSCHQHGDIFDLAENVENISKNSVIQYLADKYHVGIDLLTEKRKNGSIRKIIILLLLQDLLFLLLPVLILQEIPETRLIFRKIRKDMSNQRSAGYIFSTRKLYRAVISCM